MSTKIIPRVHHLQFQGPNRPCLKQSKYVVDDLPFFPYRMVCNARWQKEFRPTLLAWASTFADLYATNSELDKDIVMEIWDLIYPDIDMGRVERSETAPKLMYLVRDTLSYQSWDNTYSTLTGWEHASQLAYHHWDGCLEHRQKSFHKPCQSVQQGTHCQICKMGPGHQTI